MTIDPTEAASAETDPEPPRRSVTVTLPSRGGLLRGLLAAVVLALIATVVIEAVHIRHLSQAKSRLSVALLRAQAGAASSSSSLDATRASALSAATTYTQQFGTFSYQHLPQDFAATEAHSTEPFLSTYRKETAQIQADLVKLKSISTGRVLGAGVASVTPTTAVVDLFLDQTIVNSAQPKGHLEQQRVEMSMKLVAGRWLITNVKLVNA
jgi:hypothetical protein